MGTRAGDEFDHDEEPREGQVPVKPIELHLVSVMTLEIQIEDLRRTF